MKNADHTYVWQQVPVFRLLLFFIAGIIIGIFLPSRIIFACCTTLAGIFVLAQLLALAKGLHSYRVFWGLVFAFQSLFLGYSTTYVYTDNHWPHTYQNLEDRKELLEVLVVSDPLVREKSVKCEVRLKGRHLQGSDRFVPLQGKAMIYLQNDSNAHKVKYGDRLVIHTKLTTVPPPANPNQFNYKRYLAFHQIHHQSYVPSGNWAIVAKENGFGRWVVSLQHKIIETISRHGLSDEELAIVSALLVGYKYYLTSDQISAFSSSGAMHVLAVSGLHVGIIYLLLNILLKPLDRKGFSKTIKAAILLLAIWFYAALTGFSPSVARASTMFSFVVLATHWKRYTSIYNTMAVSAFILLALEPYLLVEVGFQLSYLAVFGIVLLQPRIHALWQPKTYLMQQVWEITSVSIAAQIATSPISLLYFHQFPNYFIISNLVVIPAAFFIIPTGISLLCLAWWPLAADWVGRELQGMVHALNAFVSWIESLPYSLLLGIDIEIGETYLLYLIIGSFLAYSFYKVRYYLNIGLILCAVFIVLQVAEVNKRQGQREVVFYAVSKASAIDFITGGQHHFSADESILADPDALRFHVEHHWWDLGLDGPQKNIPGLLREGPCFGFYDKLILRLTDTIDMGGLNAKADILYLDEVKYQSPQKWLEALKPEIVVASTKLSYKTERIWKRAVEKFEGTGFHSLREDGALRVELNADDTASDDQQLAVFFNWFR